MQIYLGNLSVAQIEERLGIELTEAERSELIASRQAPVNNTPIAPDAWHCFDLPFMIVCGSREMATKVYGILSPYSSQMKCRLQVVIDDGRANNASTNTD
jgi:hypothetical protein